MSLEIGVQLFNEIETPLKVLVSDYIVNPIEKSPKCQNLLWEGASLKTHPVGWGGHAYTTFEVYEFWNMYVSSSTTVEARQALDFGKM